MAAAIVASIVANVVQSRPTFTTEPFKFDLNRIFTFSKITGIFSFSGMSNLIRGVFGLTALTIAGWSVIGPAIPTLPVLTQFTPAQLAAWTADLVARLFIRAAAIFIILAVIDYVLSYRQHEESMKMTKQEIKEEYKQIEGDPAIKKRIKKAQLSMAQRRMMAEVPKATVVVTNPTHVAVALAYQRGANPAPRVVAKGKGELALRIRDVARRHGVVVYEDPPLARALYPVELGAVIPTELYKAVAEVMAYLVRVSAMRL